MKRFALVALLCALALPACKRKSTRGPEGLRDAWVAALAANDPQAAYGLLAPSVRARVPYQEFVARWKADTKQRADAVAQAKKLPDDLRVVAKNATTVHDGGIVLRWTHVGDDWLVVDGLPGARGASTPAAAIRGFIAAMNAAQLQRAERYLADDLASALREDWSTRVEAIEAALARPGAIELSEDLVRAQLRYEPQRAITLEQTPRGW
ncbi:MAG TPA: hypothetical protein VG755_01175, partial [Nannocystaceae bacterium]|nr:hypothetical protein [Nannocystaceae bacterium]